GGGNFAALLPGGTIDQLGTRHNVNQLAGGGVAKTKINIFQCPSDTLPKFSSAGYAKTNYLANIGTVNNWGAGATPTWPYNFSCGGTVGVATSGQSQDGLFIYSNVNTTAWVISIADVTDGTINTVMVGEAS